MGLYEQANPTTATGDGTAGTSGAAEVTVPVATTVDVFYDVAATSDDIKIEGSTDGSNWRELSETVNSGSVTTGGDVVSVTTAYETVRAYAGSGFADGDVTTIELTAKGL